MPVDSAKETEVFTPESTFPSPEAIAAINTIVARRKNLQDQRDAAEKKLRALRTEYRTLDTLDKDPAGLIRERKNELRTIESELEGFREKLWETCRQEFGRFSAIKNATWSFVFTNFVMVHAQRIVAAVEQFSIIVDGSIQALNSSRAPEADPHISRIKSLDTGVAQWNEALKTAGASSNFFVSSDQSLSLAVADSLKHELASALKDLPAHFNRLAEALKISSVKTEAEFRTPPSVPLKLKRPEEVFPTVFTGDDRSR